MNAQASQAPAPKAPDPPKSDDKSAKKDVKDNESDAPEFADGVDESKADDAAKHTGAKIEATAFNTKAEDVELEDAYSGEKWSTVDPFREDAEDPFTHDGFVGVDPSQALVNETRRPDPENDDVKVKD